MRFAILASGNGSNFEAIVTSFENQELSGELAFVFSDQKDAYVLKRAEKHHIPSFSFSVKEKGGKKNYEKELLALLKKEKIDVVVLAGYLRILGEEIVHSFHNKIINLHPSLLPSFPGLHGIEDAFNYGVKVTGITIHYVDTGLDTGPIIAQKALEILPEDTLDTLEEKIHHLEHELYPQVLKKLFQELI